MCLNAIRQDFPAPTIHARNLFHLSAGMWDAWAAFDANAIGVYYNGSLFTPDPSITTEAARAEAVSYAAYRILRNRYAIAVGASESLAAFDALMNDLGYDPSNISTTEPSPAGLGNRVAATIIGNQISDGSNQANLYTDPDGYQPVNPPLVILQRGTTMLDPNRWQPLAFEVAFTQNGQIASKIQTFIGSHWGDVHPFAITRPSRQDVYFDPGAPPQLGGADDAQFKQDCVEVLRYSQWLDPDAGKTIDISPKSRGNNPLGTNNGPGYPINPITTNAYPANVVNRADYGRVVAEFWADGPKSETPPGHWNVLANEIADHPLLQKRIQGEGPVVNDLEWDVKIYLALNAALHDAAIAAWDAKVKYDYVRPVSSIRHMGGRGQSSDTNLPSYHPQGLPLVPGLIELITTETTGAGQYHNHLRPFLGRIAVYCWGGEPNKPKEEYAGNEWILAEDWLPYQRDSFVTPAFAGFVSGHSTFSRAAAEVLKTLTGSVFFPGGLAKHTEPIDSLEFEKGPSDTITLQWATYYDAADEAGLSRLYGGIHVAPDDLEGRIIGSKVGRANATKALKFFDGSILDDLEIKLTSYANDQVEISCPTIPGYLYKVQSTPNAEWLTPLDRTLPQAATAYSLQTIVSIPPGTEKTTFRVVRIAP